MKAAVWPSLTMVDDGEIAPLPSAEAVIVKVGIGAGVGSLSPPPPPQENSIESINTENVFFKNLN